MSRNSPRPELTYELLDQAVSRLVLKSHMTEDDCWITTTGLTAGYSQVSIGGWPFLGHRVAWLYFFGEIPEECTDLDHVDCPDRACWNPWHVEPVTHAENMRRYRIKRYGVEKLPPIWVRNPGYSTDRVRLWRMKQGNKE